MGWIAGLRGPALACALGALVCAGSATAVLVHGEQRLDLSAAGADLPAAGYVGQIGAQSGVYLGGGWVITAHHVTGDGSPDFVLDGTPYAAIAGSGIQLDTRPGFPADLQLMRLAEPPALPSLSLATRPPARGASVVMIGNSPGEHGPLVSWDAQWKEVKHAAPAHRGYRASGSMGIRWGHNVVSEPSHFMRMGRSVTRAFGMRFDREGAVAGEAAVLNGDSGGAVFSKEDGEWRLAGILFARQAHTAQANHVAVFGNTAMAVDLSFYRKHILAVTTKNESSLVLLLATLGAGALGSAGLRRYRLRDSRSPASRM